MTSITEMRTLEGRKLIAWLESPEGEAWSRANHISATRYSHAVLVDVKDDHPAKCPGDGSDIQRPNQWGLEILSDIACYGMSGLPQAR
jgi:hypothetical protein